MLNRFERKGLIEFSRRRIVLADGNRMAALADGELTLEEGWPLAGDATASQVLGIFAKAPAPGAVKTRLCPPLVDQESVAVATAFLHDLTARFRGIEGARVVLVWQGDARKNPAMAELGRGLACASQVGADLGERMAHFFAGAFAGGAQRVVVIGSDLPTLPTAAIETAFAHPGDADVVLGPSTDGGYYCIGLRQPRPELFEGVAWSTSEVLTQTVERTERVGASLALLPPWYDVDEPEDLLWLGSHLRALLASGTTLEEGWAPATYAVLAPLLGRVTAFACERAMAPPEASLV